MKNKITKPEISKVSNSGFSEGENFPFRHSLETFLGEQMCI